MNRSALIVEGARRRQITNKILGLAFDKQRAFIDDPCRLKAAICTRRAGKSMMGGVYLFAEMLRRPGTSCLVVCLTRDSAKRIYWKDVLYVLRDLAGLDVKFNLSELSMTLPNGSVCYFLGVDAKEDEKRKVLGQKFSLVIIDESSEYRIDLYDLVYQTLKPAVSDYRGTICMVGTAGDFLGTVDSPHFWYAVTREDGKPEPGWVVHRWTAFDNPHQAAQHAEELADIERDRPLFKETTAYLTHYLAKWPSISDNLVYSFSPTRNVIDAAPECSRFVIACDLGFDDDTAFVVGGYRDHDPNLYILSATKLPELDFDQVAGQLRTLRASYGGARIVVDGANKQGVEHMRRVYSLPLAAAEKHGKQEYIRMLNTDLQMGRIRVVASTCTPLIDEWRSLEWDKRAKAAGKRVEDGKAPNHLADAALYGWRSARHFLATPEQEKPSEEEAMEQAIERRSRERGRRRNFM